MSTLEQAPVGCKTGGTEKATCGGLLARTFHNTDEAAEALVRAARAERVVKAENARLALAEARPRRRRRQRSGLTPAVIRGLRALLDEMARRQKGGRR